MPTKSKRSHGSALGIQSASRGMRSKRGSDQHGCEAVSGPVAVSGHASGRDGSSPEDAGSRY